MKETTFKHDIHGQALWSKKKIQRVVYMDQFSYTLEGEGRPVVCVLGKSDNKRIIVNSEPQTPDRTLAIKGMAPSPLPYMVFSAERLMYLGAKNIGIWCNTAHKYLGALEKETAEDGVEFYNMIEETAKKAVGEGARKVLKFPSV